MSVLVVGEALVDVVVRPDGSVDVRPGGSPANVAVGLRRLGQQVAILTCLGDDKDGRLLAGHLDGVQLHRVPIPRTSTAVATLDTAGTATYTFDFAWAPSDLAPLADWLHVGSLSATADGHVAALVDRYAGSTPVSYDPNLRPQVFTEEIRDRVLRLASGVDVVKLSDDDAALLLPGRDPLAAAREIVATGPRVVVVTLGAAGSLAVVRGTRDVLRVPAAKGGPVIDTIGAGDAFMSGLVDALHGRDLEPGSVHNAMRWGTAVACRTCERAGADPPWREELR